LNWFTKINIMRYFIAYITKHKKNTISSNRLPDEVKKKFLKKLFERFETNFYSRNKLVNFNKLIIEQAKHLEKFIMDEEKNFKPFLAKW
jgi:hypothetical protein